MRNSFAIFRLVIITAIFAICGCSESITPIDLSCPLSNSGFGSYHFGATATEALDIRVCIACRSICMGMF